MTVYVTMIKEEKWNSLNSPLRQATLEDAHWLSCSPAKMLKVSVWRIRFWSIVPYTVPVVTTGHLQFGKTLGAIHFHYLQENYPTSSCHLEPRGIVTSMQSAVLQAKTPLP